MLAPVKFANPNRVTIAASVVRELEPFRLRPLWTFARNSFCWREEGAADDLPGRRTPRPRDPKLRRLLLDPVRVVAHAGVDTEQLRPGASDAPADDAELHIFAVAERGAEKAAAVALARSPGRPRAGQRRACCR